MGKVAQSLAGFSDDDDYGPSGDTEQPSPMAELAIRLERVEPGQ